MPTFSRVSHISFSVRDAEASARWWAALLELTEIDRVVGDGWRGILLVHRWSRPVPARESGRGLHQPLRDPTAVQSLVLAIPGSSVETKGRCDSRTITTRTTRGCSNPGDSVRGALGFLPCLGF